MDEKILKLAAVGEYCITIMYLENHFQDSKFGVKDEESRNANRAEKKETEGALTKFINQSFLGSDKQKVSQAVDKLFKYYYEGMKLDKEALTYENFIHDNPQNLHRINDEIDNYVDVDTFLPFFDTTTQTKYKPITQINYLRLLITRAFLINTVFFQIFAELLIDLFGNSSLSYKELVEFARIYGLAQQTVNDNCDYLPIEYEYTTTCKLVEDTFSDMRRKLVTLPIMAFFAQSKTQKSKISKHFEGKISTCDLDTNDAQRWVLFLLKESGALSLSMKTLCKLSNYGEKLIDDPLFIEMFGFVKANRYYKAYLDFRHS